MTDLATVPASPEQIAAARALVAQADAADAAAAQAKADAARTAVTNLVTSDLFKASLSAMEGALEQAPKVQELTYAVNMMERLRDTYTACTRGGVGGKSMNFGDLVDHAVGAVTFLCDRVEPMLPADTTLVHWSLYAWLLCLLCLSPALLRIATLRARNLDPIWGLVAMLTLNRLTFLLHISREVSHTTAIALALGMAGLTTWYQRWDRRVGQ